jgi:hypothetical protein
MFMNNNVNNSSYHTAAICLAINLEGFSLQPIISGDLILANGVQKQTDQRSGIGKNQTLLHVPGKMP